MLVILVAAVSPKTKVVVFLNDGKGVSQLPALSICTAAPAGVS